MNLDVLLEAAEYIERRERETEHGYASCLPMPTERNFKSSPRNTGSTTNKIIRTRRSKAKLNNSRTTHNELEKNRRAHLRNCLEKLKEKVPLGPDGARHTTLGLLTRAKHFIKNLEDHEHKHAFQKDTLHQEQRHLRRKLELLGSQFNFSKKRRSTSESSALSIESSSTSSNSSMSESDEVDILGYGSNQSDTDDLSSINSSSSDGGVSVFTHRLSLQETNETSTSYQQLL